MKEIKPLSELDFSPKTGLAFVRFLDSEGRLLDGSRGIDSMLTGFPHLGFRACLPRTYLPLLALIAEHGGRWTASQGFAIREEAIPDLKRALRAFPETVTPVETETARALRVDDRPLQVAQSAELEGDETLRCQVWFATDDGEKLPTENLYAQSPTKSWVRVGSRFFRRPNLTEEEITEVFRSGNTLLKGDDVPFFFAKQLRGLQKERRILLGSRAKNVRITEDDWHPELSVNLDDAGRLKLGVSFKAGSHRISLNQARGTGKRAYLQVAKDTWLRNDRKAQEAIEHTLSKIPDAQSLPSEHGFEAPAFTLPLIEQEFAAIGTISLSQSAGTFRRKLLNFSEIERAPLPKGLRAALRPYQQSGYDWLWFLHQYGLRGILADDMGLGKTIQTLSVILAHTEQASPPPSVVICPASVTNVWHSEIQRWCSGIKPLLFSNADRKNFPQGLRPGTIVIASYNAVSRHIGLFESLAWSYVVLDEAHRIKNPNAASTKACKRLIAHHKLAVTGTPIQNRLAELWSIFDFLMPGYLGSAVRFQREYEIPITQNKDQEAAARLRARIDPFKLRREKSQVAKDLPPLKEDVVRVPLQPRQKLLYDELVNETAPELLKQLKSGGGKTLHFLERLLRLRQVAAHPKLYDPTLPLDGVSGKFEVLKERLEEILQGGQKALIFTQWTSMASLIIQHLQDRGIPHSYLDGQVPPIQRAQLVETFQEPEGPQIMVLSLLAGGEGITLTAASVVILFDRWWNPALEAQRVLRQGTQARRPSISRIMPR